MAVLRLRDGSLLVHSPVELDDALAEALARLGPVRHIVSPNYEHVKYAAQARPSVPSRFPVTCFRVIRVKVLAHWDMHAACALAAQNAFTDLTHV